MIHKYIYTICCLTYFYCHCQYTGSSLPKCAFNGQQCCNSLTINLFGLGINTAINDYAPSLVSGFATAQDAIDELRSATKGTNCLATVVK